MSSVRGLKTLVEVDSRQPERAVHARLDAVLNDGSRVTLLDDRGWSGGRIEDWTRAEVELTARTVVGPDEPVASRGETHELAVEGHRQVLEHRLQDAGVDADGFDYLALPHDVEFGPRLHERLQS